jgi:hypothetical protein
MLIAPPESNKTSILKQFEGIKNAKYTIDLSNKPLTEFLKNASKDKYYHLIIPDFIKIVRHNQFIVNSVIATLNALIEEGVKFSMYYGQEIDLKKNVKCGIITSITPNLFRQQFRAWNDIGFLSRFLTVSYEYSNETRMEIMKLISGDGKESLDETLTKIRKTGQKEIKIGRDIGEAVRLYTDEIVKKLKTYHVTVTKGPVQYKIFMDLQGFRLQKQMMLLARCIAFDRGLEEVNYECLGELKTLMEYIGLPDEPKVI